MKRTRLRQRSKKTEVRMKRVKPMYAKRFSIHYRCEVPGCWRESAEPHHHTIKRRLGEGLYQFRCICGVHHHHFHHVSPAAAKSAGFLDCLTESDWGKKNGGRLDVAAVPGNPA